MYNFIDVTEASEGVVLPSEAMKINGSYIEDQISGYRTLNVSGRESHSPEFETFETGIRDGSTLKSKRYPARVITVRYQIIAETNEAFRAAYNKLGGILNVEDAQLIFDDEPDMFFIGTPSTIKAVEPGRNAVIGTFEIVCLDPFKYSVAEYEAVGTAEEKSIVFEYNGTHNSRPKLIAEFVDEAEIAEDGTSVEMTGAGDCGYVAFFNEDEKIVQLGDPDEVDGDSDAYEKSQTMMNQLFTGEYAWGDTAQALWSVNDGPVLPSDVHKTGSVLIKAAAYDVHAASGTTSTIIYDNSYTNGVHYHVKAFTSNRTATTVMLTIQVGATDKGYVARSVSGYVQFCVKINGTNYYMRFFDHTSTSKSEVRSVSVQIKGISSSTTVLPAVSVWASAVNIPSGFGAMPQATTSTIPVSDYTSWSTIAGYYLTPSSYGTADGWHGPIITRQILADASGNVGATDFTLTYKQKMSIGNSKSAIGQMGAFQVNITDANGANVAGVRIHKNLQGNKQASMLFYVNGVKVHGEMVDLSYKNANFSDNSSNTPSSSIMKMGNKVTFKIAGVEKVFTDDAIASVVSTQITFGFEQYSTTTALEYNGLYWAKLVKHNCNTWKNVPNKFSANDVLIADCSNAEITLNGARSPSLGALGNDWEGFVLKPGLNQIGFSYSDWVTDEYAPTFKVRYREVFL